MKKILLMLCSILIICVSCVACSADKVEDETTVPTTSNDVIEEEQGTEVEAEDIPEVKANEVVVMGQNITAGTVLTEELLASFGTENEVLSAPSCHFDGEDIIYYYDDFNVYSYTDGDQQVIYLFELVSDKITLNSGVKIGMSREEAIELQGDDFSEMGLIVRYEIDGVYFDFSFDESDNLSLIEILID